MNRSNNTVPVLSPFLEQVCRRILDGADLSFAEAETVAQLDEETLPDLFYVAARVRFAFFGRSVRFCAILNAKSGRCSEDCKFCAQSLRYRAAPAEYPLVDVETILRAGREAKRIGAHSFGVVTSGHKVSASEVDAICEAVRALRSDGIEACASLGAMGPDAVDKLVQSGLVRYNHNLESSARHFPQLCTTHTYDDRVTAVATLKGSGLKVCCGGIFGVGESWRDRIDLAFALRELDVDTIPLNFLHPVPGTPLADSQPLAPLEILKIIALFRLIHPRREIKVAGGRERNLRDLQSWMFHVGATSAIIGDYLTTHGRSAQDDLQMIRDLELRPLADGPA